MCSYVLTRIQGSSRSPSSSDQRESGRRAKREANGNASGVREGQEGGGSVQGRGELRLDCVATSSPGGELVVIYQTEFCLLFCATVRY